MGNFFVHIYRKVSTHAKLFWILLGLFSLYMAYLASGLQFTSDITAIFPQSRPAGHMAFLMRHTGLNNRIFISMDQSDTSASPQTGRMMKDADLLVDSLRKDFVPGVFKEIIARQDENIFNGLYDKLADYLPLYLQPEDYDSIQKLLSDSVLTEIIAANYKTLMTPMGFAARDMIREDPLHITALVLSRLKQKSESGNLSLFKGRLFSKDKRHLLITAVLAHPGETGFNDRAFQKLETRFEEFQRNHPEIKLNWFGGEAVAVGNARRIRKDILLSVSIALTLLIILLTIVFRKKSSFLIIMLPVLFGGLTAFAVLAVFKQRVSAVSLGIGSVLLGISVDYALHVFSHLRNGRKVEEVLKDLAGPVLMSSTTTALAFLSLNLVQSKMLNDLGLFSAVSVFTASLFSLVALPLIVKNSYSRKKQVKSGFIDRLALVDIHRKKLIVITVLIISILFLVFNRPVRFSADMTAFNYMSPKLKRAERELNKLTGNSPANIYLVSYGKNLDSALQIREQTGVVLDSLKNDFLFSMANPAGFLLLSKSRQKKMIERWNSFWKDKKSELKRKLNLAGKKHGFTDDAFVPFYHLLEKKHVPVPPDSLLNQFAALFQGTIIRLDTATALVDLLQMKGASVDEAGNFARLLESKTGSGVVNRQLITTELLDLLKRDVNKLALWSMAFIFLFLLVAYGRIELALLTSMPVLLTWYWVTGIMHLTGLSFNIFNVIILTFVFGLGIDYSIFITRGLLQNYKYGNRPLSAYRLSVLLSVMTTVLGIGVLFVARHPALRSIALMSVIGVLVVVLLSFLFQPLIFGWMVTNRGKPRIRPVTILDFLMSLLSLLYFVTGALAADLLVLILFPLPFPRERKKLFFHKFFRRLEWSLIYLNVFSKKRIINLSGEDFSRPAIIIANHQSHADLMLIGLLHPKIVILTNARNYNNPLYGLVLRYADYIPVAEGYEQAMKKIRDRVNKGYSVLVFPEGHRSADGKIKRFHKGAFYLAQQLHLDVLPVLIHGVGTLLSKEEFFLKRGEVTTVIYPRINLNSGDWGAGSREQAKELRRFYVNEYHSWRRRLETPGYFRVYLLAGFIYKGPVLEWYARIKVQLENNYNLFNDIIPLKCSVTDIGCGYGFLDFMLAMVSDRRQITGLDYDEDKIAVVNHCALKKSNLRFECVDVSDYRFEKQDVFVLNDVLHYLPESGQNDLLERCVRNLNAGGKIIVRDADREMKRRQKGTEITEFFSTGLGFNKTKTKLTFLSRKFIEDFARKHHLNLTVIDNTRRTSNLVYIMSRKDLREGESQ